MAWRRVVKVAALVAMFAPCREAAAQYLTRPALSWRTVETPHFAIHYPREMARWAEDVARHIESVSAAVDMLVGNTPSHRVTVIVEDPSNVSNGFALPFQEGPVVFLWPTPPTPSPSFGAHRGWGEELSVHEYAHIAHLTFPTRNRGDRLLWSLLPVRIGPVARRSPTWVIEGFATYVEGKLTASGRPNSVGRAAVLRQLAVEGKLPSYAQLSGSGALLGGSMPYLAGSAFFEWLAARKGEASLNHLWRRMSARLPRSFDAAFAGVYGALPDELYGRFAAELTGKSLEVEREMHAGGAVEGEIVQRLRWYTGEPAVSPDGALMALVLRSPAAPSRLVVWKTGPDSAADSSRARARRRVLARDSLDVPPFDSFPAPKQAIATLLPRNGRGHDQPRFFADGERILVSRDEPTGDGATRPDLFIWNYKRSSLTRVTHGAAIRSADPSPDGTTAVGVACVGGVCDLVLVSLANGAVHLLAPGSPHRVWYRPRYSADGRTIVASAQRDGVWRLALIDPAGGAPRWIGPDVGASRYAASFADDTTLVSVSERGGIANVEAMDLRTSGVRTLTQMVGAAFAPEPARAARQVYFLALHARGYDVRRVAIDGPHIGPRPAFDPALVPAVPPIPLPADTFPSAPIQPKPYGLGPRHWRWLPGGELGADGAFATLMLANTDPIGRLGIVLQGGGGTNAAWRGGSVSATYRGFPATIDMDVFGIAQYPSRRETTGTPTDAFDLRLTGVSLATTYDRALSAGRVVAHAGGTWGALRTPTLTDSSGSRAAAFAQLGASTLRASGARFIAASLSVSGGAGTTDGANWHRGLATGMLSLGNSVGSVRGDATIGSADGPTFEQFAVGGVPVPYIDGAVLSQRIALPAVPVGYAAGSQVTLLRASLGGFLATPYVTWVRAGDDEHWQRIVGIERQVEFPSLAFARLPTVRIRGGAGYSFDEPFKRKLRVYAIIAYRP